MKRIFSFSHAKFLSFSHERKHKKCAEVLFGFVKTGNEDYLLEYKKLCSWMGDLKQVEEIENRFHYHLQQAKQTIKEHNFLSFLKTKDNEEGSLWLHLHTYLDGLRSCHNVGSIVRTIEAFRLGPLHFSSDMMPCDHPLIQKVSMGSWKHVSMDHNPPLHSLPRPWIALETIETASLWNQIEYPDVCTLLLGNEERGISPALLQECDIFVTIPLFGKKNSLNVSNAFAILAAEAATQKHPKK